MNSQDPDMVDWLDWQESVLQDRLQEQRVAQERNVTRYNGAISSPS